MKTATQVSLALFDTREAKLNGELAKALEVVPRYVTAKDDDGKTLKDANGEPILAVDEAGNNILASVTMKCLPRTSKDGNSLAKVSGFKGQAQMAFVERVEHEAAGRMLAKMNQAYADGTHTFANMRITASGRMIGSLKPKNAQQGVIAAAPSEVLVKRLENEGYTVTPPANKVEAKPVGELSLTGEPKPAPAAPKARRSRKSTGKAS